MTSKFVSSNSKKWPQVILHSISSSIDRLTTRGTFILLQLFLAVPAKMMSADALSNLSWKTFPQNKLDIAASVLCWYLNQKVYIDLFQFVVGFMKQFPNNFVSGDFQNLATNFYVLV